MYKLSVPFLLRQIDEYGAEQFIRELKEIGADIVFLALGCYELDPAKRENVFASLKKNVPLFQKAGFTVGVWVWTFMVQAENSYTHITSPTGEISRDQVCPSDPDFCAFAQEYLKHIAACAPDMIMFDDDYRYGFLDCGMGCTCKNHRAYLSELLGEDVSQKELGGRIFGGGRNRYRSAFLRANGHYLREFAKQSRAAVDSVDPNIRLGLCSCMSTWDFDGVSAAELSRILAGNTKPFLRLSGAPYWAVGRHWGSRLQDVIELARMECVWCGADIDLFSEGDTYPRPRFVCSANALEGFDMALRASGEIGGIHKYLLDYHADVDYDRGYVQKHIRHRALYREIDRCFGDKTAVGVRVYESMTKFEDMDVPLYFEGQDQVMNTFFSPAARMLSAQSIPTVYRGFGIAGIAFGENAKYLPDGALDNGLILDVRAAEILERRGVDVGLKSAGGAYSASEEYFPDRNRFVLAQGLPVTEVEVKTGAEVKSYFLHAVTGERRPAAYTYENAKGQRFLVLAIDAYVQTHLTKNTDHVLRQYARGAQIEEALAWMGKRLPASMLGNPDCYLLCKKNGTGMAVWIGNFSQDECMNTTVLLDGEYREVEFLNCSGRLLRDRVELDGIAPYASVGFVVKA